MKITIVENELSPSKDIRRTVRHTATPSEHTEYKLGPESGNTPETLRTSRHTNCRKTTTHNDVQVPKYTRISELKKASE